MFGNRLAADDFRSFKKPSTPKTGNMRPEKPIARSVLWIWAFGITLLAVLVLSLLPPSPNLPTTGWDKATHALAFSVLAWLGCKAFPQRMAMVLTGLLASGALIEVLQSFTSYRVAEWNDWMADALGLPLGWLAARVWGTRR